MLTYIDTLKYTNIYVYKKKLYVFKHMKFIYIYQSIHIFKQI